MKKTLLISLFALLGMIQAVAQNNPPMPLVQEGMKWVNEKVIINHGDTTKYYYTYEIQGDDPNWHWYSGGNAKLCHYYTGNHIDYSNDSIISSLEDRVPGNLNLAVDCFNNWALEKITEENRNLIKRLFWAGMDEGESLYIMDFKNSTRIQYSIHNYICYQTDPPILTEENFIEVEPIEIDGCLCPRVAYVDEFGEPKAYLVNGIGFDSRNMGDLLTPFTREPDPDADYQEYCGLSHVIKDGKIIYKGMRYNPALFDIPGDVNGDGEINIADANSVIDIVVMGGNAGHTRAPAADANDDGEVNIGDINYIINFILNGE